MGQAVTYEMDQFVPVARMFADPVILAVKKTSSWKTLQDFVAAVKSNPGQIPYASSGYLGTAHLAMEMFLRAADLKMVHVPFQGGGPAFASFVADHVPVIPTLESIAKGQIDAGNIRVLAQSGTERLPSFPDVPTLPEAGYPEAVYILWTGVFAPRKTPGHVVKILRDAIRPFMQDKAVVQRFTAAGSQVSYLDGPEFEEFLKGDTERLIKVVRKIGLS
jgi:tripartite-type tricarboxylate transporter receptor subunit TctC